MIYTPTLEAPLMDKKQLALQLLPQKYIKPYFYKGYLDREYILGTIGDRGGGKSASNAVIAIVDFMMRGKNVYSNMLIACDIKISDELARRNGLNSGGVASYYSLPLDKNSLLDLDDKYRNSCLVIEEINVQYADARRSMANTNVDFNLVCQQLRKFKTSLIYNVIDEMFVDIQLRTLTDIMIQTYDTAFDIDAMERKKPPGQTFRWSIYPLSAYMRGEQGKYKYTKRPEKHLFNFQPWHGIYDSTKHQEKGLYSMSREMRARTSAESTQEMESFMSEWNWVFEFLKDKYADGIRKIKKFELYDELNVIPEDFDKMHEFLKHYCNLGYDHHRGNYIFLSKYDDSPVGVGAQ